MSFSLADIQQEIERELRRSEVGVLEMVSEFVGVERRIDRTQRELLREIEDQFDLSEEVEKREMFNEIIKILPEHQQRNLSHILVRKPVLGKFESTRLDSEFRKEVSLNETVEALKQMGFNSGTSTFRKEFKISGVVGGKTEQRVEYISLLSQIGEGKKKGYGDEEIAFGIRRAVSQGSVLRGYLDSLPEFSLSDLLGYIRTSYKEKGATELFQDLNRLVQKEGESAQDFLFRALGLRQKVMLASEAEAAIRYDENLVKSVFYHALKTGFLSQAVRNHMHPFLDPLRGTPDNVLISIVHKIAAEEQERLGKFKDNSRKVQFDTQVKVNEIGMTKEIASSINEMVKPLFDSVKALTEQVQSMQSK